MIVAFVIVSQLVTQNHLKHQESALLSIQQSEQLTEKLKEFTYKLMVFDEKADKDSKQVAIQKLRQLLASWKEAQKVFETESYSIHKNLFQEKTKELLDHDLLIISKTIDDSALHILSILDTENEKERQKLLISLIELEDEYLAILKVIYTQSQIILQKNIEKYINVQSVFFILILCSIGIIFFIIYLPTLDIIKLNVSEFNKKEYELQSEIKNLDDHCKHIENAYIELSAQPTKEPIQYLLLKSDLSSNIFFTTDHFRKITGLDEEDEPTNLINWIGQTNSFTKENWEQTLKGKWSGELKIFTAKNKEIILDAHLIRNEDVIFLIAADITNTQKANSIRAKLL
ncbi:hypothetical protein [Sediminitomix flava]|nr:hypothetical protein [Sediminitomix flava]